MTLLSDLPDELIFHISSTLMLESLLARSNPRPVRLGARQARLALSRFSQTSSRYRAIAQPLLFRAYGDMIFRPHTRWRFLDALLDCPELAKEVRYINPGTVYTFGDPRSDEDNAALFERAAKTLCPENAESLFERVAYKCVFDGEGRPMTEDVLVSIFMAFLPNLRALKVALVGSYYTTPILLQLPSVLDLLPGCKKLETLEITNQDQYWSDYRLSEASLLLLTLPSLRKVSLTACTCEGVFELAPKSLNITDLSLELADVDRTNLKTLVHACRELKRFHFEWRTCSYDEVTESTMPHMQDILDALEPHKAHLRSLSLDLRKILAYIGSVQYSEMPIEHPAWGKKCSFAEFTALEHLAMDHKALVANECGYPAIIGLHSTPWCLVRLLPASIKSLDIQMITPMEEPLKQLAIQCRQDFPALRSVAAQSDYSDYWLKGLAHLVPLFREAGATLHTHSSSSYEDPNERESWDRDPLFRLLTVGDLLQRDDAPTT